jgi:hypothetical protein
VNLSDLLQNNKFKVLGENIKGKKGGGGETQTKGNSEQLVHLSPFLTIPFSFSGN